MVVAVAAGIRLIYELLEPVMLYLPVGLIVFALLRLASWWRGRW